MVLIIKRFRIPNHQANLILKNSIRVKMDFELRKYINSLKSVYKYLSLYYSKLKFK